MSKKHFVHPTPLSSFNRIAAALGIAAVEIFTSVNAAQAATYTMTADDGANTSSFNQAGKWSSGAAASAGNAYETSKLMRSPANGTGYLQGTFTFGGDSLQFNSGSRLLGKTGSLTLDVANLILNGGTLEEGGGLNDTMTLTGGITVNAASNLAAFSRSGQVYNNILDIKSTITGAGGLTVASTTVDTGYTGGTVRLSSSNSYSGTITVSQNFVGSATNGLLQLNNLNALNAATLQVNNTNSAAAVSFASAANTGIFNVGALSGTSGATVTLADTAGAAVTLSVGGNGGSTTYSGAIAGAGHLVKTGAGTMTLTGATTYTGTTTVNGGKLVVSGSLSNTTDVNVASGELNLANGLINTASTAAIAGRLTGSGTVGAITVSSGGELAVGNGVGILKAAGAYTAQSGAKLSIELGKTTAGARPVAGGDYDQVSATSVNLDGDISISLANSGIQNGDLFFIVVNEGAAAIGGAGKFASLNSEITDLSNGAHFTLSGQEFMISYNANWTGDALTSAFSGGNDVALLVVPEPSTWAMLVGGVGILGAWQRARRSRKS